MRYGPEHKAEIHKRLVEDASRRLRGGGLDGTAIAAVMRDNGLTHGGFYKHFKSKDDLLVEALEAAFEEIGTRMVEIAGQAGPSEAWKAIVAAYLSPEHCSHPEMGCPVAALGPELARLHVSVRKRIGPGMANYREQLLRFMPGSRSRDRERAFSIIFPTMVGAIQMARMMPDDAGMRRILKTTKNFLRAGFSARSVTA